MPLNAIFHLVAKRSGEPGKEAVAAMEEGGEGKGAAGGARCVESSNRRHGLSACRRRGGSR